MGPSTIQVGVVLIQVGDLGPSDNECLSALLSTHPVVSDPHDHLKNIEYAKGGLLKSSYEWILHHPSFLELQNDAQKQLLWVKGDPGHGKTMLLIGIIKELEHSAPEAKLAYFLCQGTNALMNTSTAILRGLIYRLIQNRPPLITHLREMYGRHKSVFQDGSSFFALSEVAARILRDPELGKAYIIIDALDECEKDRDQLLDFIAQNTSASPLVKWIVSSRKVPTIVDRLSRNQLELQLHLDLTDNAEEVASAVGCYINHKVATLQALSDDTQKQEEVQKTMREKAAHTFLWAALVIQELEKANEWDVLSVLHSIPSGLEGLYGKMLSQINQLGWKNPEFCHRVLATATLAYRPLALEEIAVLARLPKEISSASRNVKKLVSMCGSFFRVQDSLVEFIHQSARDYLNTTARSAIFGTHHAITHFDLFSQSIEVMSNDLKRNIYQLDCPGALIGDFKVPEHDPLSRIRYSCIYWVNHLCEEGEETQKAKNFLRDNGQVHLFFRKHLLHWIEALSLIGATGDGILAVAKLQSLLEETVEGDELPHLLQDMIRFLLHNRSLVERAPLQVYVSALLFSPKRSLVRRLFSTEEPKWVLSKPIVDEQWSPLIQTLEGDSGFKSITFSPDSKTLASMSTDRTISLWDVSTGLLKSKLGTQSHSLSCTGKYDLEFSNDSRLLVWTHSNSTELSVWDAITGKLKHRIHCGYLEIKSLTFSHDSNILLALFDHGLQAWETETWSPSQIFQSHNECLDFKHQSFRRTEMLVSPNSQFLALGNDFGFEIWGTEAVFRHHVFDPNKASLSANGGIWSICFSHDSCMLACATWGGEILIWNTSSWSLERTLKHSDHRREIKTLKFSHDSTLLVSASKYGSIDIWSTLSWSVIMTLDGAESLSVSLSYDNKLLASASDLMGGHVRIWDMEMLLRQPKAQEVRSYGHLNRVHWVFGSEHRFSSDLERIAIWPYGAGDSTVTIFQSSTGTIEKRLDLIHPDSLALSHDLSLFAYFSYRLSKEKGAAFLIGETQTGTIKHHIRPDEATESVFSHDMEFLAFSRNEGGTPIHDVATGALVHNLISNPGQPTKFGKPDIVFSRESKLAATFWTQVIMIWNLAMAVPETILSILTPEPDGSFEAITFSNDSTLVAASCRCFRQEKRPSIFPYKHLIFIWDIQTGKLQHKITINDPELITCRPENQFSFDPDNRWLMASLRCVAIPTKELGPESDSQDDTLSDGPSISSDAEYLGFYFSPRTDLSWIEFNGKKALYIPSDYRPFQWEAGGGGESFVRNVGMTRSASSSPVATTSIAVRSRTKRIWMTKLSETEFEKEVQ